MFLLVTDIFGIFSPYYLTQHFDDITSFISNIYNKLYI